PGDQAHGLLDAIDFARHPDPHLRGDGRPARGRRAAYTKLEGGSHRGQKLASACSGVSAIANRVSSLVSSKRDRRSSFRPESRSSPPSSRTRLDNETKAPRPEESMYPVWAKSIRNLRSPRSRAAPIKSLSSCRLPTMSWPSTRTTTAPPASLV